MNITKHISYTQ